MQKRSVVLLVLMSFLGALWWGAGASQRHLAYLRELEEFRVQEFRYWISTQGGHAYGLDQALAGVLVAADESALQQALLTASKQAYQARESLWRRPPLGEVNRIMDRWNFRRHYERMASYLHYLAHRERQTLLTSMELEYVLLMRDYALAFHRGFTRVASRVQYRVEGADGSVSLRYYPWHQISRDERIGWMLDELGQTLNLKPEVGAGDVAYRTSLDRRISTETRDFGLIYAQEPVLDADARWQRAREFLQRLVGGAVGDGYSSLPPGAEGTGQGRVPVSGSGGDSRMGEFTHFALYDAETQWRYEVGITHIGGHVFRLELRERPSRIGSEEALRQLSQQLLTVWAEAQGITLTLLEEHHSGGEIHQSFAMVAQDIVYVERVVHLWLLLDDKYGKCLELDASRYFTLYSREVERLRPQLSPAEAIAALSPHLLAQGAPRLEASGTRLVYAIRVAGVPGVNRVYINAISGAFERMDYTIPREEAP